MKRKKDRFSRRGKVKARTADHRKSRKAPKKAARGTVSRIIEGTFDYSGSGFGFCRTDSGDDVFIPAKYTLGAMTGDRVTVELVPGGRIAPDGRVGEEGRVAAVTVRAVKTIVGKVRPVGDRLYVIPKNDRLRVTAEITDLARSVPFEPGDLVEVAPAGRGGKAPRWFERSQSRAAERDPVTGRRETPLPSLVIRSFGGAGTREANYAAILETSGIPTVFGEETLREAAEVSREAVTVADGRRDLRDEIIFTLDGAGAKDLDDAVSVRRTENGGYELGVHIADVSHYVREGSFLDRDARDRGTSVYFVDKVVPMLPVELSNGCCSLNGGVDRYALSAVITFDGEGNRIGAEIFRSVIRSVLRGVYSEANDVLEKGDSSPCAGKYAAVRESLAVLKELSDKLHARGIARGAVELAENEAEIVIGQDGAPVDVARRERGETERVIEQLMLAANEAAAAAGKKYGIPFIYRVHEDPSYEKISALCDFLSDLGAESHGLLARCAAGDRRGVAQSLNGILRDSREAGESRFDTVSFLVLRSMMKAKYQAAPAGHFGIGSELYCHFTSPIRRYPDLFVHRALNEALDREGSPLRVGAENVPAAENTKPDGKAAAAAAVATDREIRAVTAEREIEALYVALYMADKVGETFDGAVSSVTGFGVFVRLSNTAEGLVPLASFGPAAKVTDGGRSIVWSGRSLRPGDPVRVILTEADPATGKLTFDIAR